MRGAESMSEVERAILNEVNMARTRPSEYAAFIQRELAHMGPDGTLYRSGQQPQPLVEGRRSYEEAFNLLRHLPPVAPLRPQSSGLVAAARKRAEAVAAGVQSTSPSRQPNELLNRVSRHGTPQGPVEEAAWTAHGDVRQLVVSALVDDGNPHRVSRSALLSPSATVAGVACTGPAISGGSAVCIITAKGFADPPAAAPPTRAMYSDTYRDTWQVGGSTAKAALHSQLYRPGMQSPQARRGHEDEPSPGWVGWGTTHTTTTTTTTTNSGSSQNNSSSTPLGYIPSTPPIASYGAARHDKEDRHKYPTYSGYPAKADPSSNLWNTTAQPVKQTNPYHHYPQQQPPQQQQHQVFQHQPLTPRTREYSLPLKKTEPILSSKKDTYPHPSQPSPRPQAPIPKAKCEPTPKVPQPPHEELKPSPPLTKHLLEPVPVDEASEMAEHMRRMKEVRQRVDEWRRHVTHPLA